MCGNIFSWVVLLELDQSSRAIGSSGSFDNCELVACSASCWLECHLGIRTFATLRDSELTRSAGGDPCLIFGTYLLLLLQ